MDASMRRSRDTGPTCRSTRLDLMEPKVIRKGPGGPGQCTGIEVRWGTDSPAHGFAHLHVSTRLCDASNTHTCDATNRTGRGGRGWLGGGRGVRSQGASQGLVTGLVRVLIEKKKKTKKKKKKKN